MIHPVLMARMAEIQMETVRQEMAKSRPPVSGPDCTPRLRERLSVRAGAALIAAGRRLQAPYEPALSQQAEAYRPGC
jgi:hypothetical protein